MKKIILSLTFFSFFAIKGFAPPPGPPSGGATGNSGTGGTPVGAPIDGGLGILLAMGALYGGKKLYQARKEKKEEKTPIE